MSGGHCSARQDAGNIYFVLVSDLDTARRSLSCGHSRTCDARRHALSQKPSRLIIGHVSGQILRLVCIFASCSPAGARTRQLSACSPLVSLPTPRREGRRIWPRRPPQSRSPSGAPTDGRAPSPAAIGDKHEKGRNLGQLLPPVRTPEIFTLPPASPPARAASGSAGPRRPRPWAAPASPDGTAPTRSDRAPPRSSGTGQSRR